MDTGAQTPEWPFDGQYPSRLVHLHAFVNYALSPYWERDWEENLLRGSGVRITVGSITSRDFLTDAVVSVNEPLGDTRFRFVYRMDWLEAMHVEVSEVRQMAGFEMALIGPVGLQALIQPTGDKEFMDMAFGLVVADRGRERYLRAALRFDDIVWADKNDRAGTYARRPLALDWTARHAAGAFELFTEGLLSRRWERAFPDTTASPAISAERRGVSRATVRARYHTRRAAFAEVELTWYDFEDAQAWRDASESYGYRNRIVTLRGRYAFTFRDGRWRAWPGVQLLLQDATASGRRDYGFDRIDWMPSAFVEWRASPAHAIEVGYMSSVSDRTLVDADPAASFDESTYTDKIKLGWTYEFTSTSRLQISLSHELAFDKFGGGNVQFMTFF